ncbi:MAG: MYXO-CTERM sorting domain-containing protein [Myxococcota bacterium]
MHPQPDRTLSLLLALAVSSTAWAEPERFSLSMFHFNVQYVAGGLRGFPSGEGDAPGFDLDDEAVQDLIVVESFEPVLDLFLAHPTWGVTLELQGLMVDVMIERHPEVLEKLRRLVDAGQAEIVSFHWSDQLFLAYPRLDMEKSHALLDASWARAGLVPSPVVFCQEGQFGLGMAAFAGAHGRDVLVLPKNLFSWQHADIVDAAPLYELDGLDVLLGSRGVATADVEVVWSFFDDGELLATQGLNPYVGPEFRASAESVARYESELLAAEAQGFRIARIAEYVAWVKDAGLERPPLPPILDGTWQPGSTDSMARWMGDSGLFDAIYGDERDNAVLTGNVRARHRIVAAETVVAHAEAAGTIEAGEYADALEACWRDALLGQVTDATGINPFAGEVEYGLAHGEAASACADALIAKVAPGVGEPGASPRPTGRWLVVDTLSGEVTAAKAPPVEDAAPAEPRFAPEEGFAVSAPGREVTTTWESVGTGDARRVTRVTLAASAPDGGQRLLEVAFPLPLDGFYLTPGLSEDGPRFFPGSAFVLQEGRIALPIADGVVGLDEDVWLVAQTDAVHVAARFQQGSGVVRFLDATLAPEAGATWVFWIVDGGVKDAAALADRLNVRPTVVVPVAPVGVTGDGGTDADASAGDEGCGCRVAGIPRDRDASGVAALAILAAAATARRRSRARRR